MSDRAIPKRPGSASAVFTASDAVNAALDVFQAQDGNEWNLAVMKLSQMGEMGESLLQIIQNADGPARAKIAAALKTVSSKRVDIRLPEYHTASQFANDLLKLNPVPEPPPKQLPAQTERASFLDSLLATVPKDAGYEEKAERLAGLSHDFRQRIAVELAPALNAKIQGMEHDTLEQKKGSGRLGK